MAITPHTRRGPRKARSEPSPRQARVLESIIQYRREHGYSPTFDEIGDRLGCSKVTVFEHVQVLRRKGLVTVSGWHLPRSVRPTGRWLPPEETAVAAELHRVRCERDRLIAMCHELLTATDVADGRKRELQNAVAQCG